MQTYKFLAAIDFGTNWSAGLPENLENIRLKQLMLPKWSRIEIFLWCCWLFKYSCHENNVLDFFPEK
jgi:hypothetical protein